MNKNPLAMRHGSPEGLLAVATVKVTTGTSSPAASFHANLR